MDVEQLFDAHHGAVVAYARRRGASVDGAHDVAAEVFAVAWRRRDELGVVPDGVERAWLLGVARRVLANHWRGDRRRRALLRRLGGTVAAGSPDVAEVADLDPAVVAALGALPARDREVLRLVAWDGLTHAEVAVVLGCTETAVSSRVVRARERLRRALDAHDEPSLRGT